jgi:Porin subfamily
MRRRLARAVLTGDVREQTSWGTLRAYFAAGWQYTTNDAPTLSLAGAAVGSGGGAASPSNTNNSNAYLLRAFIQWGGFTFGKTASFYDFFNTSKYSLQTNFLYQDYAGVGVFTYAYTQQIGNGFAATIALQDHTNFEHPILDVSNNGGAGTAAAPFTFVGDNPFQIGATGPTNSGFTNATVWNIWAAIQHYWTPEVRTSLYGGYAEYKANSSAVDANFCAPLHNGAVINNGGGGANLVGSSAVSASGCADWASWAIGSRTIWNPVKNLDIGVDVLYSALTKSAFQGATLVFTPAQAPLERLTAGSSNIVAGIVRVQYNFYP